MHPISWPSQLVEVHFLMAKLTRKDKIEIYHKRKQGKTISSLSKKYGIRKHNIQYLIRLIDYHGEEILRRDKNTYYSKELKQEIIYKVLFDEQSVLSTSIEYGLSSHGMLCNWIRTYKENNYVIVEKTKGRKPNTMTKIKDKDSSVDYDSMSVDEKIKYLENKNSQLEKSNLYLEAEAEYLKKLHAVVQKRNQQQKKK